MPEKKEEMIAPMAINHVPFDPVLNDVERDLESVAQKHGYSVVALVWMLDGKRGVTGHNLKDEGDALADMFRDNLPGFLLHNAYAMRVVQAMHEAEKAAGGRA